MNDTVKLKGTLVGGEREEGRERDWSEGGGAGGVITTRPRELPCQLSHQAI